MKHQNLKKNFFVFLSAGIALTACNNGSADTTSDTSTSMMSTDTVREMPADTGSSMFADTSKMMNDTGMNKKSATNASKKKGKATVVMVPMAKHTKISMDNMGVYDFSDVSPMYPGGEPAIVNYVSNNINYPETALNDGKEGKVSVEFTVDENGKVKDARSMGNKLGDGLDDEAVRVVSSMNDWKPGTVKGKPVKVRMTLPITFQIQDQ